jgi:hypothetical protein
VGIDGKVLQRSEDKAQAQNPLHLVSAWLGQAALLLGQVATEAKSKEIAAILE